MILGEQINTLSAGLEDEDGAAELGHVEEGEHVQLVDQRGREVLANDALPLAFPSAEVCFVVLEEVHQLHANVLFQQLPRLLGFGSKQLRDFYIRLSLTPHDDLDELDVHVGVAHSELRKIGVGVLLHFFVFVHLAVI